MILVPLSLIPNLERKLNHKTNMIRSNLIIILSIFFLSSTAAAAPTAYEMLEFYNFPIGILPQGITHYDLDPATGKFDAYWNGSCSFSLEGSYQLKYKSRISGYIYKNRLTNLSGVTVKVLFLWLNIVEVRRKGDKLEFSVGITSANFGVDNFYVCPQCGCGLNCNSLVENSTKKVNLRSHPFISSI